MNGNEIGTVEYSTELALNSNLPNLIVLNVAFYIHLIRQFGFGACKMRHLNQAIEASFNFKIYLYLTKSLKHCKLE